MRQWQDGMKLPLSCCCSTGELGWWERGDPRLRWQGWSCILVSASPLQCTHARTQNTNIARADPFLENTRGETAMDLAVVSLTHTDIAVWGGSAKGGG